MVTGGRRRHGETTRVCHKTIFCCRGVDVQRDGRVAEDSKVVPKTEGGLLRLQLLVQICCPSQLGELFGIDLYCPRARLDGYETRSYQKQQIRVLSQRTRTLENRDY